MKLMFRVSVGTRVRGRGWGRDVLPRITPRGPALHATKDEEYFLAVFSLFVIKIEERG